jgi:TolA-binding protein
VKQFLFILAVLVFISGCGPGDFETLSKKADENLGVGNIESALKIYERIVSEHSEDPKSAAVCIQIAKIYSSLKNNDAMALNLYERVMQKYPMTPSGRIAFEQHARIMESRGDFDAAAGNMISLMKYFPEKKDIYAVLLAGFYIAAKKYPEARMEIAPMFKKKGLSEDILEAAAFTYAESYFIEGKISEAKVWLQTFIREFPKSKLAAEARLHLATTLEEMGKLGAAKRVILSADEYPNQGVLDARISSIDDRGARPVKSKIEEPKTEKGADFNGSR